MPFFLLFPSLPLQEIKSQLSSIFQEYDNDDDDKCKYKCDHTQKLMQNRQIKSKILT